ncbi:MAG TPA: PHB depolymerase family esterase [Thermohalobaculum sp.]|nr:PHB depolymerase family esterase [Thermohalobaculum sp.]
MTPDLATAMRRALDSTRAQRPDEATAIIQQALAGAGAGEGHAPAAGPSRHAPTARFSLVDPAADDAEPAPRPGPSGGPEPRPTAPRPARGLPFSVVDGSTRPGRGGPGGAGIGRSLRSVIDSLARGRGGPGAGLPGLRTPSAPPAIPDGARYETRSFACPAGSRSYRLYVPSVLPETGRGLVVMLHGCTQDPDDFASGTRMNAVAEAHGLIVAYPEQSRAENPSACWNWFRPGDQRQGAGEPAILAGLTREVAAEFGVAPGRIFVAGLSAGGAMAAVLGAAYPELYAAAGIHSGLPAGSASDVASAFAAMRGDPGWGGGAVAVNGSQVRTIVFHGDADRTVHPSNGEKIVAGFGGAPDEQVVHGRAPEGRSYTRSVTRGTDGEAVAEHWVIGGAGHAWSGGDPAGSYTDPAGPDASRQMVRFFLSLPEENAA